MFLSYIFCVVRGYINKLDLDK